MEGEDADSMDSRGAEGAARGLWAPKRSLMSGKIKLLDAGAESQTNQRTMHLPSGPVLNAHGTPGITFL